MTIKVRAGIFVLVLAQGLAGCGGSDSSSVPFVPSPVVPAPATPTLAVTAVVPKAGLIGSTIRISGAAFSPGARVTLGGIAASTVVVTSTLITATTPVNAGGTVDVVVTNPSGESAMLTGGYTFEVVTLTVSSTLVAPGGELSLNWVAPSGRSNNGDWVGLFKVGTPNENYDEDRWQYTTGATGTWRISVPTEPGQYEFRYLLDDGWVDAARSTPVTVSP